jgi:hypothetical protein
MATNNDRPIPPFIRPVVPNANEPGLSSGEIPDLPQDEDIPQESSAILSFERFRRALGQEAEQYTDAQIDRMRLICDKIADAVFDDWLNKDT